MQLVTRMKVSSHVVDAFWTRLKLIWPILSLKISKMSKKVFLPSTSRGQRVNANPTSLLGGQFSTDTYYKIYSAVQINVVVVVVVVVLSERLVRV